ncbi:hypothetical protein [Roseomonas xinghualingensis]|nr:hypothetical protein [Roseomonas sp. SXEYE001]MCV4208978.1 hypothetical protein [Roseomonas sp. SXEYE001]
MLKAEMGVVVAMHAASFAVLAAVSAASGSLCGHGQGGCLT